MELRTKYPPSGGWHRALAAACVATDSVARGVGGERAADAVAGVVYGAAAVVAGSAIVDVPGVDAVFARGSLMRGAPLLGSSDIDLVIGLRDGLARSAEGAAVHETVKRLARLRRVVPALDGNGVFLTRAELSAGTAPLPLPPVLTPLAGRMELPRRERHTSAYWLVGLKAWWIPGLMRAGKTRMMARTLASIERCAARLDSAPAGRPPDRPERPGDTQALYARCLDLSERAYDLGPERLEGRIPPGRYRCRNIDDDGPRAYLVVESTRPERLAPALSALRREEGVEVVTEKSLKFMLLSVRTPEAEVLRIANPSLELARPSKAAMVRYWRWRSQPCFFRAPFKFSPDGPSICRSAARARLYLEHGVSMDRAEDIRRAYKRAYGAWPFEEINDARAFYVREYPRLWDVADRVLEALARNPLGRLEDYV